MIDLSKERSVLAMSLWVKMRLILIPPCEPNLFWLAYFLSDALCCKALKCCNFYHQYYFQFDEFLFFLLSGLTSVYLTWYQRRNSFPFRSCIYVQFRYRVVLWIWGVYLCVCFLKCCVLVDWTILILFCFCYPFSICNVEWTYQVFVWCVIHLSVFHIMCIFLSVSFSLSVHSGWNGQKWS